MMDYGNREGKPSGAATPESRAAFFDRQSGAFFRRTDWGAFWTVWAIAFALYFFTLAPTVTLEDSGELAVAADYMGVAHPPGYPLWTLMAWFFQWVFHGVTYHGYPNPAWSIGLMSAVFASLACGLLALLVSRSGADMMRGMKRATALLGFHVETKICWTAGVTAGLLLAFSPVLWSQAVIIEVYALNVFFMITLLLMIYRWMSRPGEDWALYTIAYLFGLGLTNHHTLFFLAPALLLAAAFRDGPLFRDGVALLALGFSALLFYRGAQAEATAIGLNYNYLFAFLLLCIPVGLFLYRRRLFTEWKRILIGIAAVALGLSFYLYMPVASEQNPPHNWGYTRTVEGFMRSFTRGQYEQISPADILGNPKLFAAQLATFFHSIRAQFTLPTVLMALLPFFFFTKIHRCTRMWFFTLLAAFFFVSVMLIIFLNPTLDVQTLFIQRRFLILSHAVYALWLGYSVIFALSLLEMSFARAGALQPLKYAGLALAFVLPVSVLYRNFFHQQQVDVVGGAEQRGHDFGWQFGHGSLRGVNAIREDLEKKYGSDTFAQRWAEYPNPDYPPEMEPNAIFFGGTDPGRFVSTYMIFSAQYRPDIFLITQNALADNTYMASIRDLYGDDIWIPSQADMDLAFQRYVRDVQEGRIPAGANVVVEDGRVSIQGVAGVMAVNQILSRQIFERNRHKHPFYVEESYVMEWMYPYLEPHGLILKLNDEPVQLEDEQIQNDREFWDWYTEKLLNNPRFLRDIIARKVFSKLRSSIAGVYVYRQRFDEAEHAFRQSMALYPLSPEASFRLANMYLQMQRIGEAREVIETLLAGDPRNEQIQQFAAQIRDLQEKDERRRELESHLRSGSGELNVVLELAALYQQLQWHQQFEKLAGTVLQDDQVPADAYLQVAHLYARAQQLDLLETALRRYLEREPRSPGVWIDLSAVQLTQGKEAEGLHALRQAVQLGGDAVREAVRQDNRFDAFRHHPQFRQLVSGEPRPAGSPTNGMPSFRR